MLMDILTSLAALALVLGLILGLAVLMRRMNPMMPGGKGTSQGVKVLESKMADNKHHLVVIGWRGYEYLVVSSGNGVAVVDKKPSLAESEKQGQTSDELEQPGSETG